MMKAKNGYTKLMFVILSAGFVQGCSLMHVRPDSIPAPAEVHVTAAGVQEPTVAPADTPLPTLTPQETRSVEDIIAGRSQQVIHALRDRDMNVLAGMSHPELGVRFSPYTYVRSEHVVFMPQEFSSAFDDLTVYVWGQYDGTGKAIEMTFTAYYADFVYSHDFVNAEQITINLPVGQGNTINNSMEFFPDAMIVEYYFSGFDPQYGGMDWRSLRLVFQQHDGEWFLVGIINDEWTI